MPLADECAFDPFCVLIIFALMKADKNPMVIF
jgi:hypothetical protein